MRLIVNNRKIYSINNGREDKNKKSVEKCRNIGKINRELGEIYVIDMLQLHFLHLNTLHNERHKQSELLLLILVSHRNKYLP